MVEDILMLLLFDLG